MAKKRTSHPKVSADDVRKYKELAQKIDREERDEIIETGQIFKRRHDFMSEILRLLSETRERRQISLRELARRIEIDAGNLSRLFNDEEQNPTLDTLLRIGDALEVDLHVTVKPRKAS